MKQICVVGVGYVGLVTAACFAELGHECVVAELDARKVYLVKGVTEVIDKTRSLFRYSEHVLLLTKKEARIDKAIERIEEQIDELANYSEKLGTITVSVIGERTETGEKSRHEFGEAASVDQNITPFATLVGDLLKRPPPIFPSA